MRFFKSFLFLVARFCLAAVFFWAGLGKILFYNETHQYMAAKGFPMVPLFLLGAAALEIIASFCLFIGYRTRTAATLLLLFLIPTTLIFHDFWMMEGAERVLQQTEFLKNLAIFGGLLYIVCIGAGGWSCDAREHKKNKNLPPEARQDNRPIS